MSEGKKEWFIKTFTTACEGLGMVRYSSNKSTVPFAEQYKKQLTESSCITGKIGHSITIH